MAELTNLESKLSEVIGLAMAAQGATDKVKKLPALRGLGGLAEPSPVLIIDTRGQAGIAGPHPAAVAAGHAANRGLLGGLGCSSRRSSNAFRCVK